MNRGKMVVTEAPRDTCVVFTDMVQKIYTEALKQRVVMLV